jgi:hypothetical protein
MRLWLGIALYLACFLLLMHLVDRLAARPPGGQEGPR